MCAAYTLRPTTLLTHTRYASGFPARWYSHRRTRKTCRTRKGQIPSSRRAGSILRCAPHRGHRGFAGTLSLGSPLRHSFPWRLTGCSAFQLRPYVSMDVKLTTAQKREVYGKLPPGGLSGEYYFAFAPRTDSNSVPPHGTGSTPQSS